MKAVNKLGWILFLTGFGAIVFGAAGLIGEEVAAAQLWGVFTPTPTYAALLAGHSRGLQYASVHDDPLVVHFGEIVNQVLGGAARAGGWEGKLAVAEAYRDDRWFEAALELAEDEPTVVLRYAILEATRYMSRASSASDEEREEPRQHALALLARAEELEPDNSLIWYMRSSIRFKRDTDAALAEWREGLTKSDFHTHGAEVTKALQKLFERCHVPGTLATGWARQLLQNVGCRYPFMEVRFGLLAHANALLSQAMEARSGLLPPANILLCQGREEEAAFVFDSFSHVGEQLLPIAQLSEVTSAWWMIEKAQEFREMSKAGALREVPEAIDFERKCGMLFSERRLRDGAPPDERYTTSLEGNMVVVPYTMAGVFLGLGVIGFVVACVGICAGWRPSCGGIEAGWAITCCILVLLITRALLVGVLTEPFGVKWSNVLSMMIRNAGLGLALASVCGRALAALVPFLATTGIIAFRGRKSIAGMAVYVMVFSLAAWLLLVLVVMHYPVEWVTYITPEEAVRP